MPQKPSPSIVVSALVFVQVLFGVNYVLSKVVVSAFPPLVWASIRIIISAAILMGIALLTRRPHPQGGRKFFLPLVTFALLGTIINQGSFLVGLHYTTSTNAAILNTLIPVFTLLIVTIRGIEPMTLSRGFGFLCALAGVLALRKVENFTLSDKTVLGDLLQILNCLSFGVFLAYGKSFLEKHDRVWTTAWLFTYGSVGLTLISIPSWQGFEFPEMTPYLTGCAVFAVIGGTLLTYFLNNWALAHANSSSVALFIYVQPPIAAVLAWFLFDEAITVRTAVSTGLIFLGVYLSLNKKSPPPQGTSKGGIVPAPDHVKSLLREREMR